MSIEIMSKAWKKSRQSGARLLALLALADRADEDGVCWPGRDWVAERARVRKDNLRRIIRFLEESGEIVYDPGRGRGKRTYYLVAVALEPPQIKEIAIRRFQMSEEDATVFVAEIVNRQLHHQLENSSNGVDTSVSKEKGSLEPPFSKKGVRGAPFSKKRSDQTPFRAKKESPETPFRNKKGVPRDREKGSLEPAKRGPWSPPDPSMDPSIDPSLINTLQQQNIDIQDHARARAREAVVVGGVDDFSIWDAFRLAGIKKPTARRIPGAWKKSTSTDITSEDILAWHFYREAENLNLPAGRKLRPALIIANLESGERADDAYYDRAREYLAELAAENAGTSEPGNPEMPGLRWALEAFLPPAAEIGLEALDAMSRQLPDVAEALHAQGVTPEDLNDLRLYLIYTNQPVPLPEQVGKTLAGVGADFQTWRERKAEAARLWRHIVQQSSMATPGSAIDQAMKRATPVDLNGALVVMAEPGLETYFQRLWPRKAASILSQTRYSENLPIRFISQSQ